MPSLRTLLVLSVLVPMIAGQAKKSATEGLSETIAGLEKDLAEYRRKLDGCADPALRESYQAAIASTTASIERARVRLATVKAEEERVERERKAAEFSNARAERERKERIRAISAEVEEKRLAEEKRVRAELDRRAREIQKNLEAELARLMEPELRRQTEARAAEALARLRKEQEEADRRREEAEDEAFKKYIAAWRKERDSFLALKRLTASPIPTPAPTRDEIDAACPSDHAMAVSRQTVTSSGESYWSEYRVRFTMLWSSPTVFDFEVCYANKRATMFALPPDWDRMPIPPEPKSLPADTRH